MRVLVAPDKFKGSLSALAAADALVRGWQLVWPETKFSIAPIADGGEGFAEALCKALGGVWIVTTAKDPLGRAVPARYGWQAAEKLAIIESSEASGLWRLSPEERNPLHAHTFGTGELIRDATEHGAQTILAGLGGSATTDGGIGMAAALGFHIYTDDGEPLEAIPGNLLALTRIGIRDAVPLPKIIAAADVQNPLLGSRGTARVFAAQKGATPKDIDMLEMGLENLADVVALDLGTDFRDAPGAGAAGGLGFGLLSFCNAEIRSGFDLVAEAIRLRDQIAECDLVITGEGRLDSQTLQGKGPFGVASLARELGKPVLAFAGSMAEMMDLSSPFDAIFAIADEPVSLEESMTRGAYYLERASARAARLVRLGTIL